MVASSSGSRHAVLHQTDSTGKMDQNESVKSDMTNAYLKHMCQILSVYITKYSCTEYTQTVSGESWNNAAFVCVVNMLTHLLLATWLENVRNFKWANKNGIRFEVFILQGCCTVSLSDWCQMFWESIMLLSSRVDGILDPWRREHYAALKCQTPITQCRRTISQKNKHLNSVSVKT